MHDCIADEIRYIDIPLPKESPDITCGRYLEVESIFPHNLPQHVAKQEYWDLKTLAHL